MPQLHPRYEITKKARLEFDGLVASWIVNHDLTYLEAIEILLWAQSRFTDYAIRMERHPSNPDKKANIL